MLGILVVDKPIGITSHDAIGQVRRKLGIRRVGHSGTLDPLATGVLVMAAGPATRFLQYLNLEPKEYEFTVRFGEETTTQDAEGEVVASKPVPSELDVQIALHAPEFVGEIQQIPPMFSAVKIAGKPLYELARKGEEIERSSRSVFIDELQLLGIDGSDAKFKCICSGGTYIRTLAHDLGQAIGCGGHVIELRRPRVGRFSLEQAVPIDEITPASLIPLNEALQPMEMVTVPSDIEARLRMGQRVPIRPVPDGTFAGILDSEGNIIGAARVINGSLHPECIIPREAEPDAV